MANSLKLLRNGAVGFIGWLGLLLLHPAALVEQLVPCGSEIPRTALPKGHGQTSAFQRL
jgi:hypothetical protein